MTICLMNDKHSLVFAYSDIYFFVFKQKMLSLYAICMSFHVVTFPYDAGANMKGSCDSPDCISRKFNFESSRIIITDDVEADLQNLYEKNLNILNSGEIPLNVGGDHSLAIGSVAATQEYCHTNQLTLGVLWLDAHLDYNTFETSPSKNLHGMSVAVLCGHTLNHLYHGTKNLSSDQFCYFGVRDVDDLELKRFESSTCKLAKTIEECQEWLNKFDVLHVSLDIDVLDPIFAPGVNTPVNQGKSLIEVLQCIDCIPQSKINSVDIVEYNPSQDIENITLTSVCKIIERLRHKIE